LTIKLGSLAPADSPWDKSLKQLAADWEKASSGQVVIKIYTGGTVGDESEMLRKIRLGQLQAAAITGVGINQVYKGVLALSIPMLVTTDEELAYVLENITPYFDSEISKKSFKVVVWTFAGWTHIFSKKPVNTIEDLKKQKLWVWEGNSKEIQIWKEAGFKPVPLGVPDMMTSLQSGGVESLITTPLTAAAYQWFGIAQNMNEMNWAPMIAGILISTSTWEKVPKNLQPALLDIARNTGIKIFDDTKKSDAEAITIMKKYGLKSQASSALQETEWKKLVDQYFTKYIDTEIGRDSYTRVKTLIDKYESNAKRK
jgi:TRAP-type C4-dicarboxylate transport system substrate-binding protein